MAGGEGQAGLGSSRGLPFASRLLHVLFRDLRPDGLTHELGRQEPCITVAQVSNYGLLLFLPDKLL